MSSVTYLLLYFLGDLTTFLHLHSLMSSFNSKLSSVRTNDNIKGGFCCVGWIP